MRGTVSAQSPWDVMVDLFFYREPEEAKEEGEGGDPYQEGGYGGAAGLPAPQGMMLLPLCMCACRYITVLHSAQSLSCYARQVCRTFVISLMKPMHRHRAYRYTFCPFHCNWYLQLLPQRLEVSTSFAYCSYLPFQMKLWACLSPTVWHPVSCSCQQAPWHICFCVHRISTMLSCGPPCRCGSRCRVGWKASRWLWGSSSTWRHSCASSWDYCRLGCCTSPSPSCCRCWWRLGCCTHSCPGSWSVWSPVLSYCCGGEACANVQRVWLENLLDRDFQSHWSWAPPALLVSIQVCQIQGSLAAVDIRTG